jgi:hypothetical protein
MKQIGTVRAIPHPGGKVQNMDNTVMTWVHALLFRCRQCSGPLTLQVTSDERNVEQIDGALHQLICDCGWEGTFLGVQALRHWVAPWGDLGTWG